MASEIFIKSFTGSIFILNVELTDTILDVKCKLKDQEDIPEHQRYFHGYLEFKSDDTLRNYNISESRSLMMTAILADGTSLLVSLDVDPNDTVQDLKVKTVKTLSKENLKETEISSFYFAGSMPDDKTLSECNVTNKSTIHLILETETDIKQSEICENWTEYRQMFSNIKWKNIPNSFINNDNETIQTNPYYHLIVAINKKTDNQPLKIKNKSQLINILKTETDFMKINGCTQDANNFYDAYRKLIIDKNIKSQTIKPKRKQVHKNYNTLNDKNQQLEMIDLSRDSKNDINSPLLPQYNSNVSDGDNNCCSGCVIL